MKDIKIKERKGVKTKVPASAFTLQVSDMSAYTLRSGLLHGEKQNKVARNERRGNGVKGEKKRDFNRSKILWTVYWFIGNFASPILTKQSYQILNYSMIYVHHTFKQK